MRVMVMVKATKNSEKGIMPEQKLLEDMGKFIRGIEQSVFREYLKHKRKLPPVLAVAGGEAEDLRAPQDISIEMQEVHSKVRALLDDLQSEDQQLVVGAFMLGLSTSELGQFLGIPRQTVRSRLDRAVDRFRAKIRASGVIL